jgi:hypothetical protein
MKLEKIKHGFKTLAECGGICGVDDTSSCIFTLCREDLNRLKYMSMFLRENLRMHSPVPEITRHLTKPVVIEGVEIPANIDIDIPIHAVNHHPDVWPDHMVNRVFYVKSVHNLYCFSMSFLTSFIKILKAKIGVLCSLESET